MEPEQTMTCTTRVFRSCASAVVVCALVFVSAVDSSFGAEPADRQHWVGTWATAVHPYPLMTSSQQAPGQLSPPGTAQAAPPAPSPAPLNFHNQTLRQIVRLSLGGDQVRVVLSNAFGTVPLAVGSASVGIREKEAAIVPKSGRRLTFGGIASTTIPPGAVMYSDPVALTVAPLADLAIDTYLPNDTAATSSPLTSHGGTGALQTNYVSRSGDHTAANEFPTSTTTLAWFFLARVEVMAPETVGAVVALGDSITAGSRSTPDTNSRWPSQLAHRLLKPPSTATIGVLNAGISGNRLLRDGGLGVGALARLDRDVLMQTGVSHVIVFLGINDIGNSPRPRVEELIVGHKQIIERARARGLKVYGATLTPFEATTIPNYWSPEAEAARQALNRWIRTGGAYDGVIDFDAAVRDPRNSTKILAQYDSGDHLHPNDRGYAAMADAVEVAFFQPESGTSTRKSASAKH